MPKQKYVGPYKKCPICGRTYPAKTTKGANRYYCGECWSTAQAALVLRLILEHPVTPAERLAEMDELVKGTILEHAEEAPAPVQQKTTNEAKMELVFEYLKTIEPLAASANQIDAKLHVKKGTAARALHALKAESAVDFRTEGRRVLWFRS